MIKMLRDESGIALALVLVISTIALAIMSALVYMLTAGTQISGMQKRYSTAVEAGAGGEGVVLDFIGTRGAPVFANTLALSVSLSNTCLENKLNKATDDWDSSCNASLIINAADSTTYDMSFDLANYSVYAKIVNTVEGNSGPALTKKLQKGGVVAANSGEVPVTSIPYIYSIELDTRSQSNADEKAKLSMLYQY